MKFEKRGGEAESAPQPSQDKPAAGKKPVVIYIMILFIVAFLLMALSFLMHQRSNSEVLGELQNSVSAMQEVQATQDRILALQEDVKDLEARNKDLEESLEEAAKQLEEKESQLGALQALEEVERLAAGTPEERQQAASRMAEYEAGTRGYGGVGLRPWLEEISEPEDPLSPAARYDALAEALLGAEGGEG